MTEEEATLLAQAIRKEFGEHVEVHHEPIVVALYGKPTKYVGKQVVERDGGVVEKVDSLYHDSQNGGVAAKWTTRDKITVAGLVLASPLLLRLLEAILM